MTYNYAREIKRWKQWKDEEENLLRQLGADEKMIIQLHDYDYHMFLIDRKIRSRQTTTIDTFFLNIPCYDKEEIKTVDDLLNHIENEILFSQLSKADPKTLDIILLKILGYSTFEITKIIDIDEAAIYNRIHRLRKKLKKFNE